MKWLDALNRHLQNGNCCVVVTVSGVEGSAPREVGARMVVGLNDVADTIGGGALEHDAIAHARGLMANCDDGAQVEAKTFSLGRDLAQCCGGKVSLNFEYHPTGKFNVVVFGAGHVAQSVAQLLQELPCYATFYDSREEWLNQLPIHASCAGTIKSHLLQQNPFGVVEQCPDRAYFLVMTHSHELDFDLVEAILGRGDSRYCGLIASKSKAARFRSRLSSKGFSQTELAKLTAPIGRELKTGKLPMEVAIAAVSEMLQHWRACHGSTQKTQATTRI